MFSPFDTYQIVSFDDKKNLREQVLFVLLDDFIEFSRTQGACHL